MPLLHSSRPGSLMAVCLSLLCASACRRDGGSPPPPAPPLPVRATLGQVKGSVSIKRAAGDDWVAASAGTVLHDDDKLRTGSGASRGRSIGAVTARIGPLVNVPSIHACQRALALSSTDFGTSSSSKRILWVVRCFTTRARKSS